MNDAAAARRPDPDDVFGEIAELAAQLCGVRHAAITLLEQGQHRALASHGGLPLTLLPRDSRFCCEVLHSRAPLEVSDARFDLRFHEDPLVISGPRVRFYSGVPLLASDGRILGTLAVLDTAAGALSETQRGALWKLADVLVRLLADIEAQRSAERTLSWQATHDSLTRLANRREFEAVLARRLASARGEGRQHAVLYIDLDQFKVVNDTCGHAAGDELLRQLSQVLAARMRRGDCLARLGGDEFGVVLEDCDLLHAQKVSAQLLAEIRSFRFAWLGQVFALGASIGVAAASAASRDLESVLAAADTACYVAKDRGRNRIQVYSESDEEVSARHGQMGWFSRITRSVEEGRFHLHCQRVVALAGAPAGGEEYLELLLRMTDEEGRTVLPGAFIPAAERYHLMGTIDRWVVGKALRCLGAMRLQRRDHPFSPRFGVNLSGVSLGDPAFSDYVRECFEETGTPPSAVCFEITETAAISNLARAARFIGRFRDLGCRFALDDFGAGLSSFAYLKSLPVDYLKIDGGFVRGSCCDAVDLAAVDAARRLAAAVGAKTIAECVETTDTLERMRGLGIDFAQGHLIHMPEPYPALAARLDYPRSAGRAVAA
jgi:diguanylate cyclase (GGDEF)-like protein